LKLGPQISGHCRQVVVDVDVDMDVDVDVDVVQRIAWKRGKRGARVDSFLSGWLFTWKHLRMAFSGYQHLSSLLSDNGRKSILTYNQKCYHICLFYHCVHWFRFQMIKSTCNLRNLIKYIIIYYSVDSSDLTVLSDKL